MSAGNVNATIDRLLTQRGSLSAGELAEALGISRQAAHRHLRASVEARRLAREGAGRAARYVRDKEAPARFRFARIGLAEDKVWDALSERSSALASLTGEVSSIFYFALTEMVNNAIDHSGATEIEVLIEPGEGRLAFEVIDDGEGIFEHVRSKMGLGSALEALQEISKGKVTTMPEKHTGEGIFFSSKIACLFEIESGVLHWTVDNTLGDMAVGAAAQRKGTRVRFESTLVPRQTLESLFAEYTDDLAFNKTRTTVRLFAIGARFVSRSEAKRLLRGLDRFEHVTLDFKGVESIGQGFVDEVFRVWAREHPKVTLAPVNMVEPVAFMVRRGGG